MLHVIASNQEQFGSDRTQQAQQQQSWVADLQAGLLSGKTFRRFLSQHCGLNSSMTQICCHQAFAQAVSGMIRCTASKALPLLLPSCLHSAVACLWQRRMIACCCAVQLPQSSCSCKHNLIFLIGMLSWRIQLLSSRCGWMASFWWLHCLLCYSLYLQQHQLLQKLQ